MSEKFWILQSPRRRTAKWDDGNLWRESDYQPCPADNGTASYLGFGGPANRLGELRVVLETNTIPNFIWTIPDCLIQSRVLEMFLEQSFTGFEARSARVRWAKDMPCSDEDWNPAILADYAPDGEIPMFWELLVTGWGGMAAPESGIARIPDTGIWEGCPDWSRIVDWNSWDGSDFFFVWPFAFTRLVTDRVAGFIRKHKLTGARLITPRDYTRVYASSKLNRVIPMRLRDHFPEERAREIGEPLGIY